MSIASEITRLQGVKSDILSAIANKGVTVPAGSALDDCAGLIADIPSGGGPHQEFVYKEVLGKQYKCVEIAPKVFWMCENLDYIDSNIIDSSNLSSDINSQACAYFNYDQTQSQGRFYTPTTRTYLGSIKTSVMKNIDSTYYNMLILYVKNLLTTWLGYDIHPSDVLLGDFVKGSDFDTYKDWLGLIDLGCKICGYYSNGWGKIPGGGSQPIYWGAATGAYYGAIDLNNGTNLRYYSSDLGSTTCYAVRFFIDEN